MKHTDPSHSSSSITKALTPHRGGVVGRNDSGAAILPLGLAVALLGSSARLADGGRTSRSIRRESERQRRRARSGGGS